MSDKSKYMENKKQIRMVCHLELYRQHYYFGNLKVLTDHFPKDVLGVGYKSLANHFTTHDEFANEVCTIRKRAIITSERTSK